MSLEIFFFIDTEKLKRAKKKNLKLGSLSGQ